MKLVWKNIEYITLTGIRNILEPIEDSKQFLYIKDQNQQCKIDECRQRAHENRLCVFDKCIGFGKGVREIANNGRAKYGKIQKNFLIQWKRSSHKSWNDAQHSEILLNRLQNSQLWQLRLLHFGKKNLFERLISSACKLKLVQMRHVVALKVNFEFDIINIENMPKLCTFLIKWLVNTPTIILIIKQFLSMNLDGKWKIQNEEFCNHFHFSAKLNGLFYYNFHRAWSRNFPFCVTHQIKEFYNKSTVLIVFVF